MEEAQAQIPLEALKSAPTLHPPPLTCLPQLGRPHER